MENLKYQLIDILIFLTSCLVFLVFFLMFSCFIVFFELKERVLRIFKRSQREIERCDI